MKGFALIGELIRNITGIFKQGLLWQWLPHNTSLGPWGTCILIYFRGTCDPFGFLCLPVFLQQLKSSDCMLEGQYSPPWAQGHSALLGVHSAQRNIPQNIFFHSVKLWRQILLKIPKDRWSHCHGNSEWKRGTDNMGWNPFSMGLLQYGRPQSRRPQAQKMGLPAPGRASCIFLLSDSSTVLFFLLLIVTSWWSGGGRSLLKGSIWERNSHS